MIHLNTFIDDTWVIPEQILLIKTDSFGRTSTVRIKNSGIKVIADFMSLDSIAYNPWEGCCQSRSRLGIIDESGDICRIIIWTNNLFKSIQYSGISKDGILGGTFRLCRVSGRIRDIYRLIPEDTAECEFKSKISEKYFDGKSGFTKNMIPGHLYILKSSRNTLYICIKSNISTMARKDDSPVNLMLKVTPYLLNMIESNNVKSFGELATKILCCPENMRFISKYNFRCLKSPGKDVGTIVDNPEDIMMYRLLSPEYIKIAPLEVLVSGDLWKTDKRIREELSFRNNSSPYYIQHYGRLKEVLDDISKNGI